MANDKRARLISVLLLILTFAAGYMLGLARDSRRADEAVTSVDWVVGDDEAAQEPEPPDDEPPDEQADSSRARGPVIYQLGLEPAQRERVEEIIRHFRGRMRTLNRESREAYDREQTALLDATRDSIKAILSPGQVVQYDSLLAVRYPPDRGRQGQGDDRRDRRRDNRSDEGDNR